MVSTISSAGCLTRSSSLRTSRGGVTQPVEVSLWTTQTALMVCCLSAARRFSISARSAPWRQSLGMKSTSSLNLSAMPRHSTANWPVSHINTLSPGASTLTIAASQAPVPDEGKMITGCLVRNTRCMPARTAKPSSANSGPRWSSVGISIARSTRSGTLVGPGIWRKCLPVCTVIGVLPGL
ncbi:hypothetical protein ACVWZ6_007049 [Bradyrhizobium sp. GM6.1]